MIELRRDEANEMQPQSVRVNKTMVRVYINHHSEERTNETGEELTTRTVYIADFIEVASASDDALEVAKQAVSEAILAYDSSPAVNEFTLNDTPMWLDKATRAGLKLRLEAEQEAGKETTTLWHGTTAVTLPTANAISMLNALEIYASECYDRTQQHLATVNGLESVEAVLRYELESGYPNKLVF